MDLYFKKKGTEFDTNLPKEMQIWLRDALHVIGENELTDDILEVLDIALAKVNASGNQDIFVSCKYNMINMGKDGEYCTSPFDAAIFTLNNRIIVIDNYFEEAIGEYYRETMPDLFEQYISSAAEEDIDIDEDDMTDFGYWIIDSQSREIIQVADENKSYDFTDYNFYDSLTQIKEELNKIEF